MPYPNFHAARMIEPNKFARIVQLKALPNGIRVLGGPLKSNPKGPVKTQAYRFPRKSFTVSEARAWLKEHNHKPILFEPASGKGEHSEYVGLYQKAPHSEFIYLGRKTAILMPFDIELSEYVLVDEHSAYGTIRLTSKHTIESDEEFEDDKQNHRVTNIEYKEMYGEMPLYSYGFEFKPFDEPKNVEYSEKSPIRPVDITDERFVENFSQYTPSKLSDKLLKEDWLLASEWYTMKKSGKKVPFSTKDLESVAYSILKEMVHRGYMPEKPTKLWEGRLFTKSIKLLRKNKYDITFSDDCDYGEHLAPVNFPKGDGKSIRVEDILEGMSDFYTQKPYAYLIGQLCIDGETSGDIEILVMSDEPDLPFEYRVTRQFPEEFWPRIQFIYDKPSNGPYSNNIPLYDKKMVLAPENVREMSEHGIYSLDTVAEIISYEEFEYVSKDLPPEANGNPQYLKVRGLLFRPGTVKNRTFNNDDLEMAVLQPHPGKTLCYVNFYHMKDEPFRVGLLQKIWWDPKHKWKDADTGVDGEGALLFEATITDKNCMRQIQMKKLLNVSAELGFVRDHALNAKNIIVTGMGFTPSPAVKEASLDEICPDGDSCERVDNPLVK